MLPYSGLIVLLAFLVNKLERLSLTIQSRLVSYLQVRPEPTFQMLPYSGLIVLLALLANKLERLSLTIQSSLV